MNISRLLKLVLIIEIIALLSNALAISRDYQDSWILEGLEIPFVLFVVTYAITFFSEKRISWMVALAVIGRSVFLLIPSLKYVWFSGTASDQSSQYFLANYVYNEGYIATQGPASAKFYTTTPLMHLYYAIFSTVLNIQVADSFKYVPVLISPTYPLLTYCIIKNLNIPQRMRVLKYALFISSIPISAGNYLVTGSLFGILLSFLILSILVVSLRKNDRRYLFLFIFFISVLAATHSVSSVLLVIFLSTIILLLKVSHFGLKKYLKIQAVFAVISISVAWLMFQAKDTLESIVGAYVASVGTRGGAEPVPAQGQFIPPRFFELAYTNVSGAMKTLLVFHGANVFLLLLTLGGLIILLRMRKKINDSSKFLLLFTGLLLLFIPLGLLIQIGGFRVLSMAGPLFPILSGLFILHLARKRALIPVIVFSSIIILATLQTYRCQPLIPSANVLSEDLPSSEPLVYITRVNSIYQRQMIEFARDHVNGLIACDRVTRNQIFGLAEYNFSMGHVMWYSPLETEPKRRYDCFLTHIPGVSGPFLEQAEKRTEDLILEVIYNSSIAYTNGESYILVYSSK